MEPERANLISQSEYFDSWSKIGSPLLTTNYGTSPEGLQNSTRIQGENGDRIYIGLSVVSNTYTYSIYAKGSGDIRLRDNSGSNYLIISLTADWKRYDFSFTAALSNIQIELTSTTDGEIYGAQLEVGSYPTSYIPTYGTAATRGEESFEKTGLSSVIGQTEGTIFFEFEYFHQKINRPFFQILEDSSNLYEIIALSDFKLRSRARIENSFLVSISTASVITEGIHKVAIIYKSGDYRFYLDGSLVDSSTENSILSNPSEINYFNNNNNLKQFLIFPTALSDAECITLTT
jgi:hypothetical protein